MIEDRENLQLMVFNRLGEAADLLRGEDPKDEDHDVAYAVGSAILELDLSFPLSNRTLEFWAFERGKRHAYDIIRSSAAKKFRYKQIHMQQRFEHFSVMIDKMDADYMYALETDSVLMNHVGILSGRGEKFFTYIRAGFVYDQFGNDVTYEQEA